MNVPNARSKSNGGITRRNFLGGSLLAGASATLALAGCAPQETSEAAANKAAAESPAGWSWLTPPEPIADSDISETLDCEVLVIGLGSAGTPAAMYAAQQGYDTLVLQKTDQMTTNGQAGFVYVAQYDENNPIVMDEEAVKYLQMVNLCTDGHTNLKLVKNVILRSGEVISYLIDNIKNQEPTLRGAGSQYLMQWLDGGDQSNRYAGYKKFLDELCTNAVEAGARILYETPACQLVTGENGDIAGAIAQNKDGEYIRVNASKGVVLATGDVSDDEEMLECYCREMLDAPSAHAVACNTGDGHKMGLWVGGKMESEFAFGLHFDPSPQLPGTTAPYSAAPWLHVNLRGERFMNEYTGYQECASFIYRQPGKTAYQIADANYNDVLTIEVRGMRAGSQEVWDEGLESGSIIQADTLEELAAAIEIDADALKETVNRYNEMVDSGFDEDYAKEAEALAVTAVKEPPFYAIMRQPVKLGTVGGFLLDEHLRVLDENLEPIKGLYAAGNTMGSFYGFIYDPQTLGGTSIGRALTSGVLAVKHMTGTWDEHIPSKALYQ